MSLSRGDEQSPVRVPWRPFLTVLALFPFLPQEQATFRSAVALVHVDAEVMHDGQPVETLTAEDFRITDNGERQEILHFGHREEPVDVILLFDTSASMKPTVERVSESARIALGELRAGDRVAVMAFSKGSDVILDFTEDFDAVQRAFPACAAAALHSEQRTAEGHRRRRSALPEGSAHRPATGDPGDYRRMGTGRAGTAVENLWKADAVVSGMIVRTGGMTVLFRVLRPDTLFSGGMGGISDDSGGATVKFDDAGAGLRQMIRRLRLRYSLALCDAGRNTRRTPRDSCPARWRGGAPLPRSRRAGADRLHRARRSSLRVHRNLSVQAARRKDG